MIRQIVAQKIKLKMRLKTNPSKILATEFLNTSEYQAQI